MILFRAEGSAIRLASEALGKERSETTEPSAVASAVDNFRVSISAVPEPVSLLLLTPFALGAVLRFYHRKKGVIAKTILQSCFASAPLNPTFL